VDEDVPGALDALGPLPGTLIVATGPREGGRRGRHVYGRLPAGFDEAEIPYQWAGGEVRIRGNGCVVGPKSRHSSGLLYEPMNNLGVAEMDATWIQALIASGADRIAERNVAKSPDDPGWFVDEHGRHNFIKSRARSLRGVGVSGERLRDELRRLNEERCRPPLPEAEVDAIASWTNDRVPDDRPPRALLDEETVAAIWPEPEDRGTATLSALGDVEYVEDLIRPGRIVVWAAEEGSGKSYAVDDELGIRLAVAGGSFAGTWQVIRTGPVLVLSEMHADDDYVREEQTLASLGLKRAALGGRYYRLPLMTAAGGSPALTVPAWRAWITSWLRDHDVILLAIDTATGATRVDPWGHAIQEVYADLRVLLAEYPELAIVLIVHLKKPSGRGGRQLSDVLGEWGRWNDVTVLQENDGTSLERTKITVRKRVRHERRIVARKSGGLLVDAVDVAETAGVKVPSEEVVAAVRDNPGITYAELGKLLGVSKDTAMRYAFALPDQIARTVVGPRRAVHLSLIAAPPQTAAREDAALPAAVTTASAAPPHAPI
jgi:hypothetical protein